MQQQSASLPGAAVSTPMRFGDCGRQNIGVATTGRRSAVDSCRENRQFAHSRTRSQRPGKHQSETVTADYIPFNRPYATGKEMVYAAEAQRNDHLSGDGAFTKRCHQWIEENTGCAKALLTHSCT